MYFPFTDIDECDSWGNNCQQTCENDKGTFHCGCHDGFKHFVLSKTASTCIPDTG